MANEAFGKSFFMQVALSATFFWPIFFALGWMQYRFLEITFPLPFIGFSLGYTGVFVILYIAAYVIFKSGKAPDTLLAPHQGVKGRLPGPPQARNLESLGSLLPPAADQKP